MHIFFSGIGGTGIGPLAMIAKQAGYKVSGSDAKNSQYIEYLKSHGIADIHIGQSIKQIDQIHKQSPIDWLVYSSAVAQDSPELDYCRQNNIKNTKRDNLLNEILSQKKLKLVAVAGTHGKTTTTAMIIWGFKRLNKPISYSVGAKISFGEMGEFDPSSEFFVYECDEFDRNFLAFNPFLSTITGVTWDHHEVYPTQKSYFDAFNKFLAQSTHSTVWRMDRDKLGLEINSNLTLLNESDPDIDNIKLLGWHNRANAWQAAQALQEVTNEPLSKILDLLSIFPGVSRRFEKIVDNLYTDYAHTPEKITGALGIANESLQPNQKLIVVYEPLTNRRMHHTKDLHKNLFDNVSQLYWVPSYLAREDPNQEVLTPAQLITSLSEISQAKATPKEINNELKTAIQNHLNNGDLVLCLSGGGGGSLDEWLRKEFHQ